MRIALYEPDIPQNTGTILRLVRLPRASRPISSSRPASRLRPRLPPRRHGLPRPGGASCAMPPGRPSRPGGEPSGCGWCCSPPRAATSYLDHALPAGRRPAVRPRIRRRAGRVHRAADARLRIPMRPGLRSLNVAMAAAMALGEALRQTDGFPAVTKMDADDRHPPRCRDTRSPQGARPRLVRAPARRHLRGVRGAGGRAARRRAAIAADAPAASCARPGSAPTIPARRAAAA